MIRKWRRIIVPPTPTPYRRNQKKKTKDMPSPPAVGASPGGFRRQLLRFCILCFLVCTSGGALDSRQLDALSQLYEAFRRPAALSSWNAATSPCTSWTGVSCDATSSFVISLSLPNLRFPSGSRISPPAIASLPQLQSIDLSGNSLSGPLPPQISLLRSLTSLNLSDNLLSGTLPSTAWRNLTRLRFLHLQGNLFSGVLPPELAFSSSLQSIRLERNLFAGPIPPDILTHPSLRYLALEHNSFNGSLPDTIGAAFRLRSLYLSDNQFSGALPSSLSNLTKLHNFAADLNRLSGPLPPFFASRRLNTFNVSYNNFSGPIPLSSINNWTAASFLANPFLCGLPLPNACGDVAPPSAPTPSPSPATKTTPARDDGHHPFSSKLVAAVVGGFCAASAVLLLILLLVLRLHRRRRRELNDAAAVVPEALNWFSSENQARRMDSRWEVFRRSFDGHTYEEMVAGAGHFDTAHVLGKGRFSAVYRSELVGGSVVVIKVLKHHNVPPNLERELDLLALLKHKNLLCIRGFYTNPLEKAILLDYMPGGTLYQLLHSKGATAAKEHGLDWTSRHRIAMGVAQAMVYLHGRRVLHRDLKSTNVLLEEDLTPKVADFGLVHLICGRGTGGVDGVVVETPSYTAPEVAESKRYTEKSDVYSYGVVLLELITGRKAGEGVVEWARGGGAAAEVAADPAALRSCVWPECIHRALELALRCVDVKPQARPSMASVVSVLEDLLPVLSPLRLPPHAGFCPPADHVSPSISPRSPASCSDKTTKL